ncbi:MAG: hypothetical protein IPM32_02785 [Ignavibacteriae bacterium]|nr:hypothetical protein [Ignavibacteriota bacterium]
MIDTIGLYIITPIDKFIDEIPFTSELKEDIKNNCYWLKNLKISGNEYCTYVKGSLTRFHLDTNFKSLSTAGLIKALDNLQSALNKHAADLNIYRIDIAKNFNVKKNIQSYLSGLNSLKFFRRDTIGETLYFRNNSSELCFYDKLKEIKEKKENVEINDNYSVLRYELRFMKGLKQSLKLKGEKITVENLYEKEFLDLLIDHYQHIFMRIKKMPTDNINIELSKIPLVTPKILKSYLASVGLEKIGVSEIIKHFNLDAYTSQQKYHLKNCLLNLNNYLKIDITRSDYQELEKGIKKRVKKTKLDIEEYFLKHYS